jgi:hypothetical protein
VLQQRARGDRQGSVPGPERPAVIHKTAVVEFLGRGPGADRLEQPGQRGAPTGGVDDQVGKELFAIAGPHTGHMRDAGPGRAASNQARHGHTAAHGEPRGAGRDRGDGRLRHRAPPGNRQQFRVARLRAAGDELRCLDDGVDVQGAGHVQRQQHLGQFRLQDNPEPGEEEMRQAELVDAFALPAGPGLLGCRGRRLGVPLQHRHRMAVFGQQHGRGQPANPSPGHNDLSHTALLPLVPRGDLA